MTYAVHRLVALAFLGNGAEVNHKNGDKADNRLENLEWTTRSDNCLHGIHVLKRRLPWGERNGSAKLTADDARAIRAYKHPKKYGALVYLAQKYGVSKNVLLDIRFGRSWKHI
jgi:hypothetical protein